MSGVARRRFPWWLYVLLLVIILVVALFPLGSVYFTYLVAEAHGCTVNEATVHPCVVLGRDIGGLLYMTGVLGWLMIATIPFGAMALLVWLVVLVVHRIAWVRKAGQPS